MLAGRFDRTHETVPYAWSFLGADAETSIYQSFVFSKPQVWMERGWL